jgi:putative ABC transport system permease protein
MQLRDLLPLAMGNLMRARGRVALTGIGVAIGTAALVILVALGAGMRRLSTEFTSGSPLTEIHFNPRADYRIVEGAEIDGLASEMPPSRCRYLGDGEPVVDAALRHRIADLPGVSWVAVYEMLLGTADIAYAHLRGQAGIRGVTPELLEQLELEAARGTLELRSGEAVVGAEFAASLYDPRRNAAAQAGGALLRPAAPPPDLLGELLTLTLTTLGRDGELLHRTVRVRVVGVLAPRGWAHDQMVYLAEHDVVTFNHWMHGHRAGARRDPARQGYTGVVVKADDLQSVVGVEEALQEMGFGLYTERRQLEEWASFFTGLQLFLGGIGAISLLVAAFGISNTMLMAIHERTREIGLMKAIGASNRAVVAVFLTESAGIGLVGGLAGVVVGGVILGAMSLGGHVAIAGLPTAGVVLPLWLPAFAVLFACVIGTLSGALPARRAARLAPLTALKTE